MDGKPLKDIRALIVDDSESLQVFVRRLLELAGAAHVDVAGGLSEAADLMATRTYDLAVIDLQMPEADGHQVLKTLRADGHLGFAAIAMTADATPSEVARTSASGFVACLGKPFSKDELTRTVLKALGTASSL